MIDIMQMSTSKCKMVTRMASSGGQAYMERIKHVFGYMPDENHTQNQNMAR